MLAASAASAAVVNAPHAALAQREVLEHDVAAREAEALEVDVLDQQRELRLQRGREPPLDPPRPEAHRAACISISSWGGEIRACWYEGVQAWLVCFGRPRLRLGYPIMPKISCLHVQSYLPRKTGARNPAT